MDLLDDSSATSSSWNEEEETIKNTEPAVTQKARKILSLAAVLPQHILDELTQRQDDLDSSDDDENAHSSTNKKNKRPLVVSKDGISHFLSELKAVRPTNGDLLSSPHNKSSSRVTPQPPLGAALLQTTTTVVQTGNAVVRNIHQESNEENVVSMKEEEQEHVQSQPHNTSVIKRLSLVRPVIESASRVTSLLGEEHDDALAAAHLSSARMLPSNHNRNDDNLSLMPTENDDDDHHHHETNRKRSRREMENALRKGDFQQLSDAQHLTHLEQARPDSFVPDPETYAVPQHGIKVVPTAMYDPKAGTSTQSAAGKGRGKNQIHHLMASAANLELQRARGMAGASSSSAHRANAKQKYGW